MSNYPNSLDNTITLPGVSGSSQEDVAIMALRDATFAIEKELGIKPSGIYSDVRARLDILEARINFNIPPNIPNDGYVNSPLIIQNLNSIPPVTLTISDGYGAPTENRVDGSLYMRGGDGYANNQLYVRLNGDWYPLQTEQFEANGDLTGTHLFQTVIGFYNKPLRPTMASVGSAQDGYHPTWNNTDGYWEAQTGFIPGRDLAIFSGPYGRTGQTVIGLQNRDLSAVAPSGSTSSDGDGLAWDPSVSQWQPRPRAIIFDGYVARSNLRSNKTLQSPIDNTKTGIVNFGSRSAGVTAGTTNDYSAILSGDKGTVSGNFGVMIGGDSHTVSGQYGLVGNGLSNTASGQYAIVIGGNTNVASQTYSFIGDGYQHTVSGVQAFILNGNQSIAAAQYSGILNGIGNNVAAGNSYSGVLFGNNNQITGSAAQFSIILNGNGNQTNSQNVFIGATTTANVTANYGVVVGGLANTIGTGSTFAAILNGNTNLLSISSPYALVGNGSSNNLTGSYATILNGATNVVNGLHTLVLNGSSNSIVASYSTIANGSSNTISSSASYSQILDGYGNVISSHRSQILDGYSNTINGFDSSIINGNNNTINSRNSTILNGSFGNIDSNSLECTIINGLLNQIITTTNALVSGTGNSLTSSNNSYVLGSNNTIQSSSSKVIGSGNTILSGGSFNRVFGNSNTLGTTSVQNSIFGASNTLTNSTHDNVVAGSSNIVDGGGNGFVTGATNIANANFSFVEGQYGKSRLYGQHVHANSRFTAGKVGEAQWSRIILTGTGASGAAISLQLQDTSPTNPTFQDGYSYEMSIRVLIVNTAPISPNPVVPARFIFDVLAHQEGGNLILDNVNQTLVTPQASGTPWTVTVGTSTNQLTVTVDLEAGPPFVQPTNTASSRRAIATIEMREISRL